MLNHSLPISRCRCGASAILAILCYSLFQFHAVGALVANDLDLFFHARGATQDAKLGFRAEGIGDVNHDGFDDIAVVAVEEGKTLVYYGNDLSDSIADLSLPGIFYAIRRLGDINGDGYSDVAGGNGEEVFIFYGNAITLDTIPGDTIRPDTSNPTAFVRGFGHGLTSADFDGDGLVDFVVTHQFTDIPGAAHRILAYTGSIGYADVSAWSVDGPDLHYHFSDCRSLNIDGDSLSELLVGVVGVEGENPGRVLIFDSSPFDSVPEREFWCPPVADDQNKYYFGSEVINIGDFNDDGYDDLVVTARWEAFLYWGGPVWDTLVDLTLNTYATVVSPAGDINRDGIDDIVVGNAGHRDELGRCEIYLGGSTADANMDYWVEIEDLPPGQLEFIGRWVASAGDFNGDSADDVILASDNFLIYDWGDVFVLGLKEIVSGVFDDDYSDSNEGPSHADDGPVDVAVSPNPANAAVTISLVSDLSLDVEITICDILGRVVRAMHASLTPQKTFQVHWDGTNREGGSVASGVYIISVSSSRGGVSRKVVLLQ